MFAEPHRCESCRHWGGEEGGAVFDEFAGWRQCLHPRSLVSSFVPPEFGCTFWEAE
jgi:hypothetical protein